jgi:hypothetical protein
MGNEGDLIMTDSESDKTQRTGGGFLRLPLKSAVSQTIKGWKIILT